MGEVECKGEVKSELKTLVVINPIRQQRSYVDVMRKRELPEMRESERLLHPGRDRVGVKFVKIGGSIVVRVLLLACRHRR